MTFTPIGQTAPMHKAASPSEVGGKRGATGSAIKRHDTSEIAAWLAGRSPEDVDRAAASRLSSQHGVSLTVKYNHVMEYDERGNKLGYVTSASGCDVALAPGADVSAALDDLEKFQTPAPKRQIEQWLAELSVIVAKRQDDGFSEALRLEAYASRLAGYPADVVCKALLGRTWRFWPTWDELQTYCDRLASIRRHMAATMRRGPQEPEPEWRHATPEERARAQELVDRLFPQRSPEERKAAVDEAMKGYCMKDPAPKPTGDA